MAACGGPAARSAGRSTNRRRGSTISCRCLVVGLHTGNCRPLCAPCPRRAGSSAAVLCLRALLEPGRNGLRRYFAFRLAHVHPSVAGSGGDAGRDIPPPAGSPFSSPASELAGGSLGYPPLAFRVTVPRRPWCHCYSAAAPAELETRGTTTRVAVAVIVSRSRRALFSRRTLARPLLSAHEGAGHFRCAAVRAGYAATAAVADLRPTVRSPCPYGHGVVLVGATAAVGVPRRRRRRLGLCYGALVAATASRSSRWGVVSAGCAVAAAVVNP